MIPAMVVIESTNLVRNVPLVTLLTYNEKTGEMTPQPNVLVQQCAHSRHQPSYHNQ